jgi:hypothetical protein
LKIRNISGKVSRRRPTLPPGLPGSTIGGEGLNCRVRNGTGCCPLPMATGNLFSCQNAPLVASLSQVSLRTDSEREQRSSPRTISTGRLNTLLCLHLPPINAVVCCGPYRIKSVGVLILEWASHLDAFSAYPFRTWPMSSAAGATTHTLEVRPSRSSRTRDSSPQNSCAHGG